MNHFEIEPHFLTMESFHHAPILHKIVNSLLLFGLIWAKLTNYALLYVKVLNHIWIAY